jgi:membrane protease YdiL (CAAX protease family)
MATAIGWSVAFGGIALVVAGALSFLTAMVAAGSVEGAAEWLVVLGPAQVVTQGTAALGGGFAATYVVGIRRFGFEAGDLRWRCVLPPAKGFAVGLLFGVLPAITVLLVPVLLGSGHWLVGDEGIGAFGAWSGRMALVLAPAALAEEVLFRGVPLILLAAVIGRGTAVLVVAAVFGVAHLLNPHVTSMGVANVALAGILLGTVFYGPGGMWAAFGAHLGWNTTLAVLGAAVSGLPFEVLSIDYEAGGPEWLTGGQFGPEGGMLATLVLTLTVVIAARRVRSTKT